MIGEIPISDACHYMDAHDTETGTNSIFVMTHDKILLIPVDRMVTYVRVVVDFCPQKADPH